MRTHLLAGAGIAAAAFLYWGLPQAGAKAPEAGLARAIEELRTGQRERALGSLEALLKREPKNAVGRLLYTELKTKKVETSAEMQALAEEARLRLESEKAIPPPGSVPDVVVQLADDYRHLIVVDLPRSHLYLLENKGGELKLLRHHYAAIGKNGYGKQKKGDNRTPVGIYHVTSWTADNKLPELYGAGAFPLSYPNPWDVFKQRTGSGIWLHGVPRNTHTRAPRSSEGCVTMANDDLLALKSFMDLGKTPVLLVDELAWRSPDVAREERASWLKRLDQWRADWSSLDTEAYLAHYGDDFTVEGMNKTRFSEHKRRVNAGKKSIDVQLSNINLFNYPAAGEPLVLAEFRMDYRSSNFNTRSDKQQFWRLGADGAPRIFREENR